MKPGRIDDNGVYQDPPNHCPACGSALTAFMGPEDGPAETWAHPAHPVCKWSEYENISNRQIAGIRGASAKAENLPKH